MKRKKIVHKGDCPFQKRCGQTYHGHPMFYEILDELRDLHFRKNHDYAGDDPLSNLKMCEVGGLDGWKGVVVRLTDKISRLLNFMKKGALEDESVEDTFRGCGGLCDLRIDLV